MLDQFRHIWGFMDRKIEEEEEAEEEEAEG